MNSLVNAQTYLTTALLTHPTCSLAYAVAWLDPLYIVHMTDRISFDDEGDEVSDLLETLSVCRDCFPAVYVEAVQQRWSGLSLDQLSRYLCNEMNRYLVAPLPNVEAIRYGVPCEAIGLDLLNTYSDIQQTHPEIQHVLQWFGLETQELEDCYQIARQLIMSLEKAGPNTLHADMLALLDWLFGLSGNTLVDFSIDMLWEAGIEPLDWTPENIELMNAVQTEANEIFEAAQRALALLKHDTDWSDAMKRNIKRVKGRKSQHDRLEWPSVIGDGSANIA